MSTFTYVSNWNCVYFFVSICIVALGVCLGLTCSALSRFPASTDKKLRFKSPNYKSPLLKRPVVLQLVLPNYLSLPRKYIPHVVKIFFLKLSEKNLFWNYLKQNSKTMFDNFFRKKYLIKIFSENFFLFTNLDRFR